MSTNHRILFVLLIVSPGCGRRMPSGPPSNTLTATVPSAPVSAPVIPAPRPKREPVTEFRAIVEGIKREGTPARSVAADGKEEKLWQRRRFEAVDVSYEIKKTELEMVPLRGEITWTNVEYVTPPHRAKVDAERERLEMPVRADRHKWHATFSYRRNRWELNDVWWTNKNTGRGAWHSKRDERTEADPVVDWYRRLDIAG